MLPSNARCQRAKSARHGYHRQGRHKDRDKAGQTKKRGPLEVLTHQARLLAVVEEGHCVVEKPLVYPPDHRIGLLVKDRDRKCRDNGYRQNALDGKGSRGGVNGGGGDEERYPCLVHRYVPADRQVPYKKKLEHGPDDERGLEVAEEVPHDRGRDKRP